MMRLDASRIVPGLYQGAYPRINGLNSPHLPLHEANAVIGGAGFDVWLPVAEELPNLPGFAFDDGEAYPDLIQRAAQGAGLVLKARADGKRVLVTCNQGRNRSGLVIGLALTSRLGPYRCSPEEAVGYIRQARGAAALSNHHFVNVLRQYKLRAA